MRNSSFNLTFLIKAKERSTTQTNKMYWRLHIVFILSPKFTTQSILDPALDGDKEFVVLDSPTSGGLIGTSMNKVEEDQTIDSILSPLLNFSQVCVVGSG